LGAGVDPAKGFGAIPWSLMLFRTVNGFGAVLAKEFTGWVTAAALKATKQGMSVLASRLRSSEGHGWNIRRGYKSGRMVFGVII